MIAQPDGTAPRPTPRPSKEVIETWESEGGRPSRPNEGEVAAAAVGAELPKDVDALEDVIMKEESPEGLPPPKEMRRREWKIVGIVAAAILIPGMLIAAAMISTGTLLAAVALLVALVVAASPVWGAALMRGKEHKVARHEAEVVVLGGPVGEACAVDPAHGAGPVGGKPVAR